MYMSDPFKIRDHVGNFELVSAMYRLDSAAARTRFVHQSDIAYGDQPRQTLDLFFPEAGSGLFPVHIFIHGGYWRANRKDDYAFLAETICGAGAIAAIVEYTLMPQARMGQLVGEVRNAARWIASHAPAWNGDITRISASGHSAGAHLCTYLAARGPFESAVDLPSIKTMLLVSGIYDLRPITTSFLQTEIGLTEEEVAVYSPLGATFGSDIPVTVTVGSLETEPFHLMAQDYAFALSDNGVSVDRTTMPALNHMDIVSAMGRPGTAMAQLLTETIAKA